VSGRARRQAPSDRLLGGLAGALVGLMFGCCLGGGLLLLSGPEEAPPLAASQPPAVYDLEVVVEEDYINRVMVETSAGMGPGVPLEAGHLDIRPGGLADFVVQIGAGPLHPVFDGTLKFSATAAGQIELSIASVRAGYLPVTAFVPPGATAEINRSINLLFAERAGPFDLRVAGVTSDDSTLHFYLAFAPGS
jgi:hypothetical protein